MSPGPLTVTVARRRVECYEKHMSAPIVIRVWSDFV